MDNISKIVGLTIVSIAALVVLSFLLSYPIMLLWNGCLVGAADIPKGNHVASNMGNRHFIERCV